MALGATLSNNRSWLHYLTQDLQSTPGRLNSSLRITLASVFVLIIMMVLQMPFIAYGLYAIFMVSRESPAVTLRTGIAQASAVLAALAIALVVVILTDNDPMARVVSLAAVTFVGGMIAVATSMPALGSGWGLFFCIGIGFWENHTPEDTLVKNSLWLLASFSTGFTVAIAIEYLFATRSPAQKLTDELRIRYRALEAMFRAFADDTVAEQRQKAAEHVSRLAAAGNSGMLSLYTQVVDRNLERGDLPLGVHVHITMLAELLDNAAAFGLQEASSSSEIHFRCATIARVCGELARTLKVDMPLEPDTKRAAELTHLDRVESIVSCIETIPADVKGGRFAPVGLPSKGVPFLIPGAIGKAENVAFSLKISLCATICYIIYHAIDWPGISTSVVTVMVATLFHSGAMKQRLVLRISGVAVGGLALGMGAQIFLFPFMDSITSLVVVIGGIAFLCAWVGGGSRFGYFGMQMAFAFYLTALVGFSAPTELGTARDRFVGISLGIIVMWFVLDQIWPVRTITAMRRTVVSVLKDASRIVTLVDATFPFPDRMRESNILRDRVGKQLSTVRTLRDATRYEFGVDHANHMRTGETFMGMAITAVALIWDQTVLLHMEPQSDFLIQPTLIRLRQTIAQRLSAIADALEQHGCLGAGDGTGPIDVASNPVEYDSEYSRNTISRFNELYTLALSLDCPMSEASHIDGKTMFPERL